MVAIKRLHCHSSLAHYEMFHCKNSSYGNSVFNYTYNINNGSSWGGNFWSGLWGGLGMGLGAGIMNLFGGGLGNMYGSPATFFGMGGGYPMINMFGNGLGNISNWFGFGGKDKAKSKETEKAKDNTQTPKTKTKEKVCGGDSEYLHTLRDRLNKIKSATDPAAAAKSLYNDIEAVIKKQKDDEHNTHDEHNYKDLKTDLLKEWQFELNKDGDATSAKLKTTEPVQQKTTTGIETVTNTNKAQAATVVPPVVETKSEEKKFDINEFLVKVDGKTNEYEPIKALTPDALQFLKDNKKYVVRFAKHQELDGDKFLTGTIESFETSDDKKTVKSYVINCGTGSFKLQYKVTPNGDGTAKIVCTSKNSNYYQFKKDKNNYGIDYIQSETGMLENKTGYALIKRATDIKNLSEADKKKYEQLKNNK